MGRIEWTRYSGDDIETVLGICLCLENRDATRIKPSRGDKGIDIFVPESDGWTVYQVKSFIGPLTTSRKNQIKKSWAHLMEYVDLRKVNLKAWYLVTPEDPTTEKIEWLQDEVTGETKFPAVWKGEGFADGLVARNPEVVDYYFHDGKGRLEETVEQFLHVMRDERSASLDMAGSIGRLRSLHALINKFDPHFRYDFTVQGVPEEDPPDPVIPETKGLVASVVLTSKSTRIIVNIVARYLNAVEDRPVPGSVTVSVDPNSEGGRQWREFVEFGTPFKSDAGLASFNINLPGGLGGGYQGASVWIGPAATSRQMRPIRLDIHGENDEVLRSAIVHPDSHTVGPSGKGSRLAGKESGGVFEFEIRVRFDDNWSKLTFRSLDFTGARPSDVLNGLEFLEDFRPPNSLQISVDHGPTIGERIPILEALDGIDDGYNSLLTVRALAIMQKHTVVDLRVPDLSRIAVSVGRDWLHVARLLNGEMLGIKVHRDFRVCLPEGQLSPDDGAPLSLRLPFKVLVDTTELDFGFNLIQVSSALQVDGIAAEDHDGHTDVWMRPAEDSETTIRWISV